MLVLLQQCEKTDHYIRHKIEFVVAQLYWKVSGSKGNIHLIVKMLKTKKVEKQCSIILVGNISILKLRLFIVYVL